MSLITLPSGGRVASFEMAQTQSLLRTLSGITQVTSFPDRAWEMKLQVVEQKSAQLRAWALAMNRLQDRSNWFAFRPPYYSGPSTGYAGAGPHLVKGAGQAGLSLVCDGFTPSVAVMKAGDMLSFDVTTGLGNTNRQLVPITADASSNVSGEVTFALAYPIRLSPADNAAVNITTPSAYFMLTNPRGGVPDYKTSGMSGFTIEAMERILP